MNTIILPFQLLQSTSVGQYRRIHVADLDANHDGKVDKNELHKMMGKMKWTDKDMVNGWYKNLGFMPTNPANK